MNTPDPIPKNVKILQIILSSCTGLLAMILWQRGFAGFIAFVLTFTITYTGIAMIYLKNNSQK